jgi:hypothetical protein
MPGIFERLSTLAGSDIEKAADLAHRTFQGGLADHGHHGRAFVETLVELCRDHPNLVGIGVGVLVEQLLSEEKRAHDRKVMEAPPALAAPPQAEGEAAPAEAPAPPAPVSHLPPRLARWVEPHKIRPGRLALEVFGALMLLKFSHAMGHIFRGKRAQRDGWLASAAKIHLLSASIATYYFSSALRSPKVSAWRNAAVGLFGTDAIKPLLKPKKPLRNAA